MKTEMRIILILILLLSLQPATTLSGQDKSYSILDILDVPAELLAISDSSCPLEFKEEWILNTKQGSISKIVNEYEVSCALKESFQLKEISYEFSFPDARRELQHHFISLIRARRPIPRVYSPHEQLLSVFFHEEWTLDADTLGFIKRVIGITPVIWQLRQSSDGESIPDAETGLPVYYKTRMEMIMLRNP